HDLAFEAAEQDGERGFRVLVGGGTSICPRIAPTLFEFVSFDEYLKVSEAVLRIFSRCDELRANRAHARIKFYIDRIGIEAFRDEVSEELKGEWVNQRNFDPEPLLFIDDEAADAPAPPAKVASPNGDMTAFNAFVEHNVIKQRQRGYSAVGVKVFRGDLSPEQLRGLAEISRTYTSGRARTTQNQNLVLRWVPDEAVYEVWTKLGELGLGDPGLDTVQDIVSCPGTDSCKLGITSSMGLNEAIHEKIAAMNITDPLTKKVDIRMSGCPNGCSQHHIASIGFNGAAMRFNGKQVPAYIVQIGGRGQEGKVNFGNRLKVRIPAKRAPEAVERWLRLYEAERNDGEEFADFSDRVGTEPFEVVARDLALPVEYSDETEHVFVDWQRSSLFEVVRGEGECAL
ncbi:MAG: nitrite/sulfite reductase, partial [Thermoleophilia bacterium]|nr:nitrite/sulfite reductase [Thermoleophilia bacterium]